MSSKQQQPSRRNTSLAQHYDATTHIKIKVHTIHPDTTTTAAANNNEINRLLTIIPQNVFLIILA